MDSDWKMNQMHNDTFFVAYNLLDQKLWPHTFSCMSVDVNTVNARSGHDHLRGQEAAYVVMTT